MRKTFDIGLARWAKGERVPDGDGRRSYNDLMSIRRRHRTSQREGNVKKVTLAHVSILDKPLPPE